jgi:hypothetical protein
MITHFILGKRENLLNKCVYLGHRALLHPFNMLRYYGQTSRCCPRGFHDIKLVDVGASKSKFQSISSNDVSDTIAAENENNLPQRVRKVVFDILGPCEGTAEYKTKIRNFIHEVDERDFVHANQKYIFDYLIFDLYLYYPTCDFRPQKTIQRELQADFGYKGISSILFLLFSPSIFCSDFLLFNSKYFTVQQ